MENQIKKCGKCGEEKSINDFNLCKKNKDGLQYYCKTCCDEYRSVNKNKIKEYCKSYNSDPKNKLKYSKYYIENREQYLYRSKKYKKLKKDEIKEYNKIYFPRLYKNNIQYKLSQLLRNRFYLYLKGINRKSFKQTINCDYEIIIKHIENQFLPEMTWDNHGIIWEIDHIIPISSFDLTLLEEQQKCFHYSNLQPLFKTTEIAKSFGYENHMGNRNKQDKIL